MSHCRHASIRTLEERTVRSVHVGRSRFSRCCHLISDLSFHFSDGNVGLALDAVTGTRLWLLIFPSWNDFDFVLAVLFYAAAATVMGLLLCNGSYTSPLTHR